MPETRRLRARFWVMAVAGTAAAVLLVVTLISREWIEEVFGVDPDGGDGSLEWLVVLGLAAVTVVLGLGATVEWRRSLRASPQG